MDVSTNVLDAIRQLKRAIARAAATAVCVVEGKPVTLRHAEVLRELRREGPTQQVALARASVMDPSLMCRLLEDLDTRGLVSRRRNDADRRQVTVSLTARGRKALGAVDAAFDHLATQAESALTRDERAIFIALADKIARSVDVSTDDPDI
jgi:DNA-binding MarR family transcriptional regulator